MFNIFNMFRSSPEKQPGAANIVQDHPLKLGFLECAEAEECETTDNNFIILPSDRPFCVANKQINEGNEKSNVSDNRDGVELASPDIQIPLGIEIGNLHSEMSSPEIQPEIIIGSEIEQNRPRAPDVDCKEYNNSSDEQRNEREISAVMDEPILQPLESQPESKNTNTEGVDSNVRPQIFKIIRRDPADNSCKKHSLGTILADSGVEWNESGYHRPRQRQNEKNMVVDCAVFPSVQEAAMSRGFTGERETKIKINTLKKTELPLTSTPPLAMAPLIIQDIPRTETKYETLLHNPTAKEIELETDVKELKTKLDGIENGINKIKEAQDRGDFQYKTLLAKIPENQSTNINVPPNSDTEANTSNHTGNTLVVKSYGTFVLNDYVNHRIMIQEDNPFPGASITISSPEKLKEAEYINKQKNISDNTIPGSAACPGLDISIPPDIEREINNIKSFGMDFDPKKLDVIDSYSVPNPIYNPMVYIVKDGYKLRYLLKEPVKPGIYNSVREVILRNIDLYKADEKDPVTKLNVVVDRLKKKYPELKNLSADEERALRYYLFRDFIGYREIDVPMNDDNIEDITCVGYGIPVFIYHQKYYNLVSDIILHERELDATVLRLSQEGGKHISVSEPIVDATLRNGTRAQLTYKKTATEKGSTFTLRRFRGSHITPVDLIENGTYTPEAMAYLWKCVQHGKNVLIVGGTATGKTTNLNACSLFIPPEVKIVSIEDTREIKLYQKNWIPSTTTKDIDTFSLLKAALRQRPEYIIVGEVRGKEAQTLFQAMTSGHIVMSTFHAGSVDDLVNRLTSSPIDVPPAMIESLDIIVVLKNEWTSTSSRHRYADAIYEQQKIKGVPRFVKIYDHGKGLSASLITPEIDGKIQCLSSLITEGVRNPDTVSERIISQMYVSSQGR